MKRIAQVASSALVSSLVACSVVACSGAEATQHSAKSEPTGSSIGLALQPVSGVTLNTVHYVVTKAGSAVPVLEGDLPATGTAKVLNVGLPIPVGTGYELSLSGVAVESKTTTCAAAIGPFSVRPNQSTNLSTQLACTDAANGALKNLVTQTVDGCPRLIVDFAIATPNSASVGHSLGFAGLAHDLDGKTVSYAWQATGGLGAFATPTAASTTFTCQAIGGSFDVTLTASNGECTKSLSTKASCADPLCGNGFHDVGELCDGSAGDASCPPNCMPSVCGNGVVEVPAEQCDPIPADPDNCTATCQTRVAVCGDGFLSAGEQCDPNKPSSVPCGATCSAACQLEVSTNPVCVSG